MKKRDRSQKIRDMWAGRDGEDLSIGLTHWAAKAV